MSLPEVHFVNVVMMAFPLAFVADAVYWAAIDEPWSWTNHQTMNTKLFQGETAFQPFHFDLSLLVKHEEESHNTLLLFVPEAVIGQLRGNKRFSCCLMLQERLWVIKKTPGERCGRLKPHHQETTNEKYQTRLYHGAGIKIPVHTRSRHCILKYLTQ